MANGKYSGNELNYVQKFLDTENPENKIILGFKNLKKNLLNYLVQNMQ